MGHDKAFLYYRGQTLLERSVGILQAAGLEVSVVTSARLCHACSALGLKAGILVDQIPDAGPLGGLLTALGATSSPENYFLSCDTPLMEARFFQVLASFAHDFESVVPQDSQGRLHPLCAYYGRSCLAGVQKLLEQGTHQVDLLLGLAEIVSLVLPAAQLGIPDRFFFNVNTPEDLKMLETPMA